eukprot:gb/GECH01006651.1/.p1 GENE.gb/GECH01006651.1/~~gb/GECH01006651.1/.p1  ORF type:complete len:207 (+),score=42.94 gb/GECH01006651.1/:1-621(+)
MKLISLLLFKWKNIPQNSDPIIVSGAYDMSSFGFFQRSGAKEFATFLSRTLADPKRTPPGTRKQVTQDDYYCFIHARTNGMTAVLISDKEYHERVAFSVLSKALYDFDERFGTKFLDPSYTGDFCLEFPELTTLLSRYQNPEEADSILRIQKDLEETKTVMHEVMDKAIGRGDQLDDLVERSSDLSAASKQFYTTAKSQNSCCSVM